MAETYIGGSAVAVAAGVALVVFANVLWLKVFGILLVLGGLAVEIPG